MIRRIILAAIVIPAAFLTSSAASADDREEYDTFIEQLSNRLDRNGELALRIIALGMENYQVANRNDADELLELDEVVCYFDEPTGSSITHVICREFQHTAAGERVSVSSSVGAASPGGGVGGTIMGATGSRNILTFPVRERKAEQMIAMLPGLPEMNERLVYEGVRGLPLPVGLPTRDELDLFVDAYIATSVVDRQYQPLLANASGADRNRLVREFDDAQAEAIEGVGLTVSRYNEITEHVGTHSELWDYVVPRIRSGG